MSNLSVLQTKLTPPRPPRHTLARPRVDALLRDAFAYRVTIVQASTGYGKSTALAHLADARVPLLWYSASEGDADPQQFLAHLKEAGVKYQTRRRGKNGTRASAKRRAKV